MARSGVWRSEHTVSSGGGEMSGKKTGDIRQDVWGKVFPVGQMKAGRLLPPAALSQGKPMLGRVRG